MEKYLQITLQRMSSKEHIKNLSQIVWKMTKLNSSKV